MAHSAALRSLTWMKKQGKDTNTQSRVCVCVCACVCVCVLLHLVGGLLGPDAKEKISFPALNFYNPKKK